jgi:hypothetical protein
MRAFLRVVSARRGSQRADRGNGEAAAPGYCGAAGAMERGFDSSVGVISERHALQPSGFG